ncbi:hypothetical protein [Archangium lansingense]|uniref:Farnesoic acid O-methyl transferase domain-containing protein n=1 Tax=Archangium lansingense TaxID=2995310 RepID=A0ABT4AI23_9BACT|nr:hypothetical protein [Archangium lansinium]MCY1081317.1 hypothetical protein [Archangium lansinium]
MGQARRKEKNLDTREPQGPEGDGAPNADAEATVAWKKPEGLSRRGWAVLAVVILAIQFPLIHYALFRGEAATTASVPYSQDFSDPSVVERDFFSTGGHWRVVNGQLLSPGVKNNPLWLQAALPPNVAIEFDVRSESQEGDIKAEVFGDGTDHASGYIFIHGGWNNSLSIIARLDEHGTSLDALQRQARRVAEQNGGKGSGLVETGVFKKNTHMRVEARPYPVEVGRTYHWRIERRGSLLRWSIDGKPFMEFDDPLKLEGKGHDRFGFSSWDSQLFFDNLKIEPL